jgi:uncharacterized protein (TIGR02996 family)
MSAEAGFLADICDHPADRTVRLIYADWLDEHRSDDPVSVARARFIRLQCELENLDPHDGTFIPGEVEAATLLKSYRHPWLGELLGRVGQWEFCGGFPEHVSLSLSDLHTHGTELRRAAPVRSVALHPFVPGWDTIPACPALAGVEDLDLDLSRAAPIGTSRLFQDLVASPNLAALEGLTYRHGLGAVPSERLVATSLPARLRRLSLHSRSILPPALFAANWERLESLHLAEATLPRTSVTVLETAGWFARLRRLILVGAQGMGSGPPASLPRPREDGHLEELSLIRYPCLGVSECLRQNAGLRGLRVLRLRDCDPVAGLLGDLGRSSHITRLHTLDLGDSHRINRDLSPLVEVIRRHQLRTLDLSRCRLEEEAVTALLAVPEMRTVQRLRLHCLTASRKAVAAIIDSPHLDGLCALEVGSWRRPLSKELLQRVRERFPFAEAAR